ncbi:hypothetical protein AVU33_gp83 [Enterobacteria phage JenP2]|uniref:Uncharacterized protein n=1 Tax=Enterobacteria phage JenP2 TaxID=1610838 RepID=A0A0E3JIZ0_9CAUD|nr:hypothetical protein AVU33_gp83 [Enterobacteria phage JenP2]AKA61036.1 hypothetical protein [Enterobacteria phage JenP2]
MSDPTNAQLAAARVYMRGAAAEIEALPQFEKHVQQLEHKFKALKDLGDKKDAIAFLLALQYFVMGSDEKLCSLEE